MTSNNKQARRAAAQAEADKRYRQTEARSPLDRAQLQDLLDMVAEHVAQEGHSNSFEFTDRWLDARSIAAPPVHAFLNSCNVHDDYELIIQGDPWTLFGPTPERTKWMPIERQQLLDLMDHVDQRCEEHGCDHTHRFTRDFLANRSLPVSRTEMALLAQGGGCDCEVVLNVEPDTIYPAIGRAAGRP